MKRSRLPGLLRRLLWLAIIPAVFLAGHALGPQLRIAWDHLFPEPEYVSGDYGHVLTAASSEVVLFATRSCPYCARARELLKARGTPFREYLVDESEAANREFAALEGTVVPLLFIGDRRIVGFRESAILDALQTLASNHRPPTRPSPGSS